MKRRNRILVATAIAAGVCLAGGGAALASGSGGGSGEDTTPDRPATGSALAQASAVALKATGGGTVTGTEVGDEESYYEVEVTLGDGSQVDVQLDEKFNVVSQDADNEHEAGDSAD
jgi:hypothetical protein